MACLRDPNEREIDSEGRGVEKQCDGLSKRFQPAQQVVQVPLQTSRGDFAF